MTAILDTPTLVEPPAEDDDTIRCDGCGDDRPHTEIRDRAGWALCGDCDSKHATRDDKRLTRTLAYTH